METYDSIMYDLWQEEKRIAIEEKGIKKDMRKQLKGLVNITGLYRHMDESQDWWLPIDIVELQSSDERMSGYPNYETARIVNDEQRILYMKQSCDDIRGINHEYVYQRTDGEDSYSGYLLYPLKNGKYLKINFNC